MDLSIDINQALARSATKEQIANLLRKLTLADRHQVLIDLLVTEKAHTVVPAKKTSNGKSAGRGRPAQRKGGRRALGRTEKLIAALRSQQGMPIKELSIHVYGSDSKKTQNQVRALLTALKRREGANNPKPGYWVVTD